MNTYEAVKIQPENEVQKLPIIGVNTIDRRIYVNGDLRLQFPHEAEDKSWNIFKPLMTSPQKIIGTTDFLHITRDKTWLRDTLEIIGIILTPELQEANIVEEVVMKNQVVGFRLNAKVSVVK